MRVTNAFQALDKCVHTLEKILDLPLGNNSGIAVFPPNTINDIRGIAERALYDRKKTNFGVIGGSLAGIAGGIISIVGAALLPFTFGTSLALVISGGAVGLAGAGTSIKFTTGKIAGDKKRVEEFEPYLKMFVDFNKVFAESIVTIHELLMFLRGKMNPKLSSESLNYKQHTRLENIEKYEKDLYEAAEEEGDIYEKLKLIDACVKQVHIEIGELVKYILTMKEIKTFPETAGDRKDKRENGNENEKVGFAFDHLVEAIPSPSEDENGMTFRVFVRRYLEADLPEGGDKVPKVGAAVGQATGKVAIGGAAVGGRAALRVLDASDNLAKVGGTVARISRGVSAASIVLSALGIGVDLAFLGHAVYDLIKLNMNEEVRSSRAGTVSKIESTEFADLLRDLADVMDLINGFCKTPTVEIV